MFSTVRDQRFSLLERTVKTGEMESKEKFFSQTRNRGYHFLPTVDVVFYPLAQEFFPFSARYEGERGPSWWRKFGVLTAFSIADPSKDFVLGTAWASRSGFGVKVGAHLSFQDRLPEGIEEGQTLPDQVISVDQRLDVGLATGVTLDTRLFKSIFGVIFK